MIDLYYYVSPNARKVLIALEELELPYQIKWTSLSDGDHLTDEFMAINPNAKIPAIVDHDGPGGRSVSLFESAAILLYLAEKTGKLLPEDPERRWEAVAWTVWQVANQGPMTGQATHFIQYAPKQGIDEPYATGRYKTEARRCYEVMETRLEKDEYLAGEFSIADIACFPWTRVAKGHGVDISEFPNIVAWSARIAGRPSAKVKVDDPRAEAAKKNEYDEKQFKMLFRPGTDSEPVAAAPAGEQS